MTVIRPATSADAEAMTRVHVIGWRTTYHGIVPTPYLDAIDQGEWLTRRQAALANPGVRQFIAEKDNRIVGFSAAGPNRGNEMAYLGELYALYLFPDAQKCGLGRGLLRAAATALYQDGLRSMIVWVLRDNPACAFYERMGARPCAEVEVTLGGAQLPKLAYGWSDLSVLVETG